jgi:polysaccharide biosynthesis transport protein
LDRTVHTPEDVQRSTGIATVSMMPIASNDASGWLGFLGPGRRAPRNCWLTEPTKFLLDQPDSEQSEAIRGLHTAVMLSNLDHPPHALLVTSSVPGEGKTTVAINLAVALAQHGSTCILDADLRRSLIAKVFHLKKAPGLGEYLSGAVPLELVLSRVPGVSELTVIAAGEPADDPGKLVNSEKMRQLLRTLRTLYDFVVVDSPPILPYADGRALAPFVDGVVFVGRSGVVTRDAIARSIELLAEVHGAPILEIVLNGADTNSHSYGYGYKYGDYKRAS